MSDHGVGAPEMVHPTALCESRDVGARTRIWAFAHVMPGAAVGADCNLCDHTYVDDGARLGDFVTLKNGVSVWDRVTLEDHVFVGPNVAFTNDRVPRARPYRTEPDHYLGTLVREGAVLGANATILCGTTIGRQALVGAGSVVTRDVPDHGVVLGAPARQVGWICTCGERLGGERLGAERLGPARSEDGLSCACGRTYRATPVRDRIVQIEDVGLTGRVPSTVH